MVPVPRQPLETPLENFGVSLILLERYRFVNIDLDE